MKRTSRRMPIEQRMKISESMKGKKRSEATRRKISDGMRKYWEKLPVEAENNLEENIDLTDEQMFKEQ